METIIIDESSYAQAKVLIEGRKPSKPTSYSKKGPAIEPSDKPYTKYDDANFAIDADEFVKDLLSSESIPYISVSDYENWSKRLDAVATLKNLVDNSPITAEISGKGVIPLREIIQTWYESRVSMVSDFQTKGDRLFFDEIKKGDEFWWDLVSSEEAGSVREQAVNLIKPLVV